MAPAAATRWTRSSSRCGVSEVCSDSVDAEVSSGSAARTEDEDDNGERTNNAAADFGWLGARNTEAVGSSPEDGASPGAAGQDDFGLRRGSEQSAGGGPTWECPTKRWESGGPGSWNGAGRVVGRTPQRSVRRRRIIDDDVDRVITLTLETIRQRRTTRWSARSMAQRCGLSHPPKADRIWRAFGLRWLGRLH